MRLLILFVFIAVCLTGVWLLQDKPLSDDELAAGPAFSQFNHWDEITALEIRDHQGVRFSAVRSEDAWAATHLSREATFPIDSEPLKQMVQALSDAVLLEYKTHNPELYVKLGVEDVKQAESGSVLVSISSGARSLDVLVGKPAVSGAGQYVRISDQPASMLIDRRLNLPTDTYAWLKSPLLSPSVDDVIRVDIKTSESEVTLQKDDQSEWRFAQKRESQALIYPTVIENAVADLLAFDYDDVELYDNEWWQAHENTDVVMIETESAGTITLTVSLEDEEKNRRVSIQSDREPWLAAWQFRLAPYQASRLLIRTDDLVREGENDKDDAQTE